MWLDYIIRTVTRRAETARVGGFLLALCMRAKLSMFVDSIDGHVHHRFIVL